MNTELSHYTAQSKIIKEYYELKKETDKYVSTLAGLMGDAIYYRNIIVIEEFLRLGFDLNFIILCKQSIIPAHTCLTYSCCNSYFPEVRLFLKSGANVNGKNRRSLTALWYAIFYENIEMVKLLLKKGADIDILTNEGFSPLMSSYTQGKYEMTEFLLQKGAKITYDEKGNIKKLSEYKGHDKEKIEKLIRKYEFLNKKGLKSNY